MSGTYDHVLLLAPPYSMIHQTVHERKQEVGIPHYFSVDFDTVGKVRRLLGLSILQCEFEIVILHHHNFTDLELALGL